MNLAVDTPAEGKTRVIRILLLEDSPLDAELVSHVLESAAFPHAIEHVTDGPAFSRALDGELPDLILADYVLPGFDGIAALAIARQKAPEVPFVFVSGTLGEEVAIEALKQGATDYVLKQRLRRLPDIARRALAEAHERNERLRAQRSLEELNATLEARIAARTRSLQAEIEERKRVEDELRRSEERYRAIFDHSPESIFVLARGNDGLGYVIDACNRGAEAVTGKLKEEMIGRPIGEMVGGDVVALYEDACARSVETGHPQRFEYSYQRDGRTLTRETILVPLGDSREPVHRIIGSSRDVTARKETEATLRQAQKMEAVGQMTGGIAHDFNNLLTVVLGNLELIQGALGNPERVTRLTKAAGEAARRGERLTQSLLAFARRQTLRPQTVDVNELIKDFEPLVRRAVGEMVTLDLQLEGGVLAAKVDAGQLEAAILNLAVNSRDAMPRGGRLLISTHMHDGAAADASGMEIGAGEYVVLRVTDSGSGIPAETLPHVFEPFFTTKEVGKGTGLGLSQVYGFVRQSGGAVRIDSREGAGTAVTIYLPRIVANPEVTVDGERAAVAPVARGTVALVVEDDPHVLTLAKETLTSLGFTVIEARDGVEAMAVLNSQQRVDMLFSDVVMPRGISGPMLAREARALRPQIQVLLTSGYTAESMLDGQGRLDGFPVLGKPYRPTRLAETIERLLAERN